MAFPFLEKMVSYSYVRRWYFEPKTNQDIYLEYESYVTDCTDMEDVLQMLIGTGGNPVTVHGCTGAALQNGESAAVVWLIGTPEKGISFRLSSSSFTAEALLRLRKVCSCNSDSPNRIHRGLRHSLSTPIRSAGSGMDGAVCLRETAFLFHHSICAGKSRCRRFLDLVSGKNFSDSTRKTVALIPAVCYTGGAYTIPEWR